MAQSINLIPQQEVREQTKTKVVKLSTILSIMLLIIVAGGSFFFFFEARNIKSQNVALESDIEGLRASISSLDTIEITARNLDKKHTALQDIFDSRVFYSKLLQELSLRQPNGISVKSFSMRSSTEINISGTGANYISISDYTNNLLASTYGDSIIEDPFTEVTLNSVSLESQTSDVTFAISVIFDPEAFK